ncbi:MAG: phosphoribosylaminoimidazolesuccinocarboxamide synthase [Thermodesulfobacteriota bacterium]
MKKLDKLYEGKAKIIYATDDPELVVQYFKDDATAFNGEKKGTIRNKGEMNNAISSAIFRFLEDKGVETHFVSTPSSREMVVRKVEIVPIEVVMRNVTAGSLSKRMGVEEGMLLPKTVFELYYKDDSLGDPMINGYHVAAFGLCSAEDLAEIKKRAFRVNELMEEFFSARGITLVDFKLEFGKTADGTILLADEITPDGCRLWNSETGEKMDKDRFRRDLGSVEEAYEEVMRKVVS